MAEYKLQKGSLTKIRSKKADADEMVKNGWALITVEGEEVEEKSEYASMKKDELIALAVEKGLSEGVDLASLKKTELIELIEKAE